MARSLLTRSRNDATQFGEFYRQQVGSVTRFFASRLIDADAALDLTAETFAQAYKNRRRFRGETDEQARAWLFTIARRQLARYLRRGYADDAALKRLGLERPVADAQELMRIEELGAMDALRAVLTHQLEDMPPDLRAAVQLRVVDELSYAEVASRLSITESAARMRVSRALSRLRLAVGKTVVLEDA